VTTTAGYLEKGMKYAGEKVVDASKDILPHAAGAVALFKGPEDGEPLPSGFVTFKRLLTVTASLQMIQTNKPFEMQVSEAPAPQRVIWENVGRTRDSVQLGIFLAFSVTVLLCIFWTVPVTFILSVAEVEAMKENLPKLEDRIEESPWLEALLQQLAPILLWLLGELLYVIIDVIVKWEGHVGASALEASRFTKLAAFEVSRQSYSYCALLLLSNLLTFLARPSIDCTNLLCGLACW